ncbi:UDP-N-acetylmuramate--L-alanine ligase [Parvularcula bermudensis HTCC2503]|uniref:UDP-N-acetylmuramate--L-alanine ligase n=1 Tax=Parvularcula bermudensis (strain ATCC BAA-594 / HTCC2503 / KCTC 12087) TaxID=314260 RepID=E0TDT2_PARBH|nr:UDP-N-acetylmuramate--L-alanine ligase [Parvularcula bermudensis]ADM09998.1 UDP-N-acetylmuramate--L-alanine ligase [Parvularcula bermudensis HTCC2503]
MRMPNPETIKINVPFPVGTIHFVGIGGIGMSGIAEIMNNLGYRIQGSDIQDGPQVARLREQGISVQIGHRAANVENVDAVVVSTAIGQDNPELAAARARHVPVVRRADMLAELMRLKWNVCVAGTHGKTTTTSMIGSLLDAGDLDPTVINGGIINNYASNARPGTGDWMVVEADESDGTFIRLPATVGVITNIDPEHLDHYGDFAGVRAAFDQFVANLPFYGFAAVCLDHPEVQALVGRVTDRRLITYGFNPQADVRAENLDPTEEGSRFDIIFRKDDIVRLEGITLPMPGRHNVLNALAAAIVAREMGVPEDAIRDGFARFRGVRRRFTEVGKYRGARIIDDYGHHPVEIAATLSAARTVARGRVIAVMQPHRYTRLQQLFDAFCGCFNDADLVMVGDVYPAGEMPIEGMDKRALADGIARHGHRGVEVIEAWGGLSQRLRDELQDGDVVICLGAGDITKHAATLSKELTEV